MAVEVLTTIFWFAGFIALAVAVDKYDCAGHVCGVAKAAAVFGGFEWYNLDLETRARANLLTCQDFMDGNASIASSGCIPWRRS
jgi:hypothetical protein